MFFSMQYLARSRLVLWTSRNIDSVHLIPCRDTRAIGDVALKEIGISKKGPRISVRCRKTAFAGCVEFSLYLTIGWVYPTFGASARTALGGGKILMDSLICAFR